MEDLIGKTLGRYHILEQLGKGGMATVYKAFDMRLEREVAVKVILPSKQQSEISLKRFEREAQALAKLTHPNIVHINDFGEQDGIAYLVMDYLPGGTLKQKLGKPIPWQETLNLLLPIARALEFAHQRGIIHRDVKPSNVMLTEGGEPMLTDFGVAKMLETEDTVDLTGTSIGVGTPEYMAPEYMTSHVIDQRVDIYALGIVLYELLAGRKPYQADTPLAVLYKHTSEPLPRPALFATGLPSGVEQLVLKMLAKNPGDRFSSMTEVAQRMEGLLSGHVKRGKSIVISKGGRTLWGNRKMRMAVVISASVLFMVLAGLGVSSLFKNTPTNQNGPSMSQTGTTDDPGTIPVQTNSSGSGSYGLLYSDDFSDNDSAFLEQVLGAEGNENTSTFQYSDGRYLVTNDPESSDIFIQHISYAEGWNFQDAILSLDFELVSIDMESWTEAVIAFRWTHANELVLLIRGDGLTTLYSPYTSDFFFEGYTTLVNGVNHLDLEFIQDVVTITINSERLTQVQVNHVSPGEIGLGAGAPHAIVAYDNVFVYGETDLYNSSNQQSNTISGSLRGTDGIPITGVLVALINGTKHFEVISDDEGEFTYALPYGGVWDVQLAGYTDASNLQEHGYFYLVTEQSASIPQSAPLTFIFEKSSAVITGEVVNRRGTSMKDACCVMAERSDGARFWVETDSHGNFELPASPGQWRVYWFSGSDVHDVTISSGDNPPPMVIIID